MEPRKLSGFIDRQVDLLKIDVEGSKVEILRDIIHSGKIGFVRQIIVEYHPELASAALDLLVQDLRDAGFSSALSAMTFTGATEWRVYAWVVFSRMCPGTHQHSEFTPLLLLVVA